MGRQDCVKLRNIGISVEPITFQVTAEKPFTTPSVDLRKSWSIRLGPSPHSRNFDALSLAEAPRCDIMEELDETFRKAGDQPAE